MEWGGNSNGKSDTSNKQGAPGNESSGNTDSNNTAGQQNQRKQTPDDSQTQDKPNDKQANQDTSPPDGACGNVVFDCAANQATIGGKQFPMYCGTSTPNSSGKLGKAYTCPKVGRESKYWMMSECVAMNFSSPLGGDPHKLIHGWPAKYPVDATANRKGYHGWGCIHVGKTPLEYLRKNCSGAPYTVQGAYGSRGATPRAKK